MKKSVSLMAMVLTLGTLASCGPKTSNTGGGESYHQAGPKEITFWHCIGHDKMTSLERVIEEFNKAHENTDGYYVTAEKIAGDYDALHDAIKTRLNAGRIPSITMGYPDSFAEYIGNQGEDRSMILKLDNFINSDSDFHPETMVQEYYEEGQSYQYDGTWSVPLYKSTEVMYYNVDLFQSTKFYQEHKDDTYGNYGAILGQPKTWDWDTLVYVANEIQKEMGNQADFHAIGYDSDSNLFISQMAQRNIPYTTAEGEGDAHYLFYEGGKPNDQLVDLACELYDMAAAGTSQERSMVTQATYGTYASDLFLQQKVMFTIGSTGGSVYNDPNGKFQAALVPVPSYQNNHKYIMQGPSLCFFNTRDSAKEAAAWEFYSQFVSDPELNAGVALENSYDPVRTSSYDSQVYQQWCAMGLVQDNGKPGASYSDQDNLDAAMANRIPNLTSIYAENEWYITSDVFMGSGTAREEIGMTLAYADQSAQTTTEGKVRDALKRVAENCVL